MKKHHREEGFMKGWLLSAPHQIPLYGFWLKLNAIWHFPQHLGVTFFFRERKANKQTKDPIRYDKAISFLQPGKLKLCHSVCSSMTELSKSRRECVQSTYFKTLRQTLVGNKKAQRREDKREPGGREGRKGGGVGEKEGWGWRGGRVQSLSC